MPGFLDSKHTKPIQLLVANLTSLPIKVKKGQLLAFAKVCDVKDIKSMHPFGTLEEFNLPVGNPQVLLLFKAKDFPNLDGDQIKQVLQLLKQYRDIFSTGPLDYGQAQGVSHQIDTGDSPPFRAKPYQKSRVKDEAFLKN